MTSYKVKTFNVIEYGELDKLVNQTFNPPEPYEFVMAEEADNYSNHTFTISQSPYEWEVRDFMRQRNKFEEKDFNSIPAEQILRALALLGKIPFGNWLVRVFW